MVQYAGHVQAMGFHVVKRGFGQVLPVFCDKNGGLISACHWRLGHYTCLQNIVRVSFVHALQRKPNWRLEDLFVVEQHQTALEYDQTPRHPINVPINGSDDVPKAADRITYNKAAAVLRMIRSVVTEDNFHQPLKSYLQNFK